MRYTGINYRIWKTLLTHNHVRVPALFNTHSIFLLLIHTTLQKRQDFTSFTDGNFLLYSDFYCDINGHLSINIK